MKPKHIYLSLFIILALVQIYFPARTALQQEKLLKAGVEYRFKTAPVDPNDPFRGKYVSLSFEENIMEVPPEEEWVEGDRAFVALEKDEEGFAKITAISKLAPTTNQDYLEVSIQKVQQPEIGWKKLLIRYPFDRYYMEESKAYDAEIAYREAMRDSSKVAYAAVLINEGKAVLDRVMINDQTLEAAAEARQNY